MANKSAHLVALLLFCFFFKLYLSLFKHRQLTVYVVVLFLASARPCLKNTGVMKMYGICHSKKVPMEKPAAFLFGSIFR